ncbi:MAG: preprotein translocase subunit YajC [Thermoleophilia bacterium]|nr:preprotein translocase subunit YajC [Thermoleophilia bacterium]
MGGNIGLLALYVLGFIAIFYFMAIRPQQRQKKAHEALVASVRRGDKVITAGGIHGTIKRVEDGVVTLEVAKGVTIKLARRAIAEVLRDTAETQAPAEIEAPDNEPPEDDDTV